jgi:hypothetical protein
VKKTYAIPDLYPALYIAFPTAPISSLNDDTELSQLLLAPQLLDSAVVRKSSSMSTYENCPSITTVCIESNLNPYCLVVEIDSVTGLVIDDETLVKLDAATGVHVNLYD